MDDQLCYPEDWPPVVEVPSCADVCDWRGGVGEQGADKDVLCSRGRGWEDIYFQLPWGDVDAGS